MSTNGKIITEEYPKIVITMLPPNPACPNVPNIGIESTIGPAWAEIGVLEWAKLTVQHKYVQEAIQAAQRASVQPGILRSE